MRMARPLALQLFDVFARLGGSMSPQGQPPSVQDLLDKAQAGNLQELKSTQSVTLPNGVQHSLTVEAESTDPAELAAFKKVDEQNVVKIAGIVREYHSAHPQQALSSEAVAYLQQQDNDLKTFGTSLQWSKKSAAKTLHASFHSPTPSANALSVRWQEYFLQVTGTDWSKSKTAKSNQRMFGHFQAWLTQDIDIASIDRDTINRFINHLLTERVVEAGDRRGQKGLDQRSVDNYTSIINKFLTWAQNKEYFPNDQRLPTAKQALVSRKARKKREEKANPPYTLGQLKKIFDPKQYEHDLAHHFWPPLIALFSGARRREIAQLLLSDFYVEDGIHGMSINVLEDEDKSVKTPAAVREIPVHPVLIELGLLDYIEDVRALDLGPELFPGIGINADGEKGNAVGHAWGRYLDKVLGKEGSSPTFHSFRSTALGILKKKKVSFEMRCQLAGHEFDHVSQVYSDEKFTLAELTTDAIPKWVYEGLDLSGLKYTRNQFDRSTRGSTTQRIHREKIIAAKKKRIHEQ